MPLEDGWYTQLIQRWKPPRAEALRKMDTTRYTWSDVRAGKEPRDYAQEVICGSPIWDEIHENNRVLGFFRYAHTSGVFKDHCLIVAADHILDKGYIVVNTVV